MDDIDKLIELAKNASPEEAKPLTHVEKFIKYYGVKEGNSEPGFRTTTTVLYWFYLKWCKLHEEVPMPRVSFFRQFGKYFKKQLVARTFGSIRCYQVLPESFPISKEELRIAEMDLRDEMEFYKKRRKIKEGQKRAKKEKLKEKKV